MASKGGNEEAVEFGIGAGAEKGGYESPARSARYDFGEEVSVKEGTRDAEMVVGKGSTAGETQGGAAKVRLEMTGESVFLGFRQLGRVQEVAERGLEFINEFLGEVLGAVVGLTIETWVFDADEVVLDAGFH